MNNHDKADVMYGREWHCGSMAVAVPKRHGTTLNHRGMTLIELIVVCAILGALILIAIPAYTKYKDLARESRAMSEIRVLEAAITAYYSDKNAYPDPNDPNVFKTIGYGGLIDPWGNAYQYKPAGTRTTVATDLNSDYDLYSLGVDGLSAPSIAPNNPASQDDIIRASDGAFVGRANQF